MIGSREPTHAGGVVYRTEHGSPRYLVVTARRKPQEWVLPKGHIEHDETPEHAAVREVYEESGVSAAIVDPLEDVRIHVAGEDQVIRYFLMRALEDGSPGEGRRALWLPAAEALHRLSFPESRAPLRKALHAMHERGLT
jgi:8-oxo-dGTP pyrophosphatase MutT (NUDIX family)